MAGDDGCQHPVIDGPFPTRLASGEMGQRRGFDVGLADVAADLGAPAATRCSVLR